MFDRRLIRDFDWFTLLLALAIAFLGALGIYSSVRGEAGASHLFLDHLLRLGVGFVALAAVLAVDYRFLVRQGYFLFGFSVLLLVGVELVGKFGMGAQRWLSLGGVMIQPSEFLKISMVLMLARYLGGLKKRPPLNVRDVLPTLVAVSIPFFLILIQPDLGTAIVVIGIYGIMLFVSGLDMRVYAGLGIAGTTCAGILTALAHFGIFNVLSLLKDYQVRRLTVLFNPDLDPLGAGYHINQSKIAIGSGGISGKGFLQGTQTGLNFLPQQHTDFIFSVLAEEGGFIFSVIALALMLTILLWGVNTARKAQDRSGSYVALGVVTILFIHFSVNIGMTTGLLPVVGLPLPLMSYGGSSVLTSLVGIGLVMNVRMRRFIFN
jgi:rod shape determining protein RodA